MFDFDLSDARFATIRDALQQTVSHKKPDPDNNMVLTEVRTFSALIMDRGGNSGADAAGVPIDRNRWKIRVINESLTFEKGDTLDLPNGDRVFVNHIRKVKNLLSLFADSERLS